MICTVRCRPSTLTTKTKQTHLPTCDFPYQSSSATSAHPSWQSSAHSTDGVQSSRTTCFSPSIFAEDSMPQRMPFALVTMQQTAPSIGSSSRCQRFHPSRQTQFRVYRFGPLRISLLRHPTHNDRNAESGCRQRLVWHLSNHRRHALAVACPKLSSNQQNPLP